LIFNAKKRVTRSLEYFNNFPIRSETNLRIARAWDNYQLGLKCLDSLWGFVFIDR